MAAQMGLSHRGAANVDAVLPRISAAVEERAKKANTNIDLSTAENWLLRDELVALCKDAVRDRLEPRHFSYADGFAGDSELLDALCGFFNGYFCPLRPVVPEHLATAPGAATALNALLSNICEDGDGVLVPAPYWNGFDWLFSVRSGVHPIPVVVDHHEDTLTKSLLPALLKTLVKSPRPIKALVLTNPHNPFGRCYPLAVIERCINFCQDNGIHFVSDEVYALSGFGSAGSQDAVPFVSALSVDAAAIGADPWRVHVVWSTSKDFGSSGFRMGCAITQANRPLQVGISLSANTQMSALTAISTTALLTSPNLPFLLEMNSARLSVAYSKIALFLTNHNLDFIPVSHGPFVFARIAPGAETWEDEELAVSCCKQAGVVVSPGKAYHVVEGQKGWARLTFAIRGEQLDEALRRLWAGIEVYLCRRRTKGIANGHV